MKLKHCQQLFLLSKDKRPIDYTGKYSTIDNAAFIPYQKFKKAKENGYTISIKLGPIGDTGYSIYCIDCDHCDCFDRIYGHNGRKTTFNEDIGGNNLPNILHGCFSCDHTDDDCGT